MKVLPVDGYQSAQSYLLLTNAIHWLTDQASFWWMVDKSAVRYQDIITLSTLAHRLSQLLVDGKQVCCQVPGYLNMIYIGS
jgi:hypothetical protein